MDFLHAQLCRSFGFASTRFGLRSPGFASLTRPWSLFTGQCIFVCLLLSRDAIFFSSPQLAKKRRQIRFLDFGVPSGLHSISKFFEFLHSIARLHMGRSLRSAPPKSASWIIRLSALLPFVLKSFGFFHSFRSLRCYEFRAALTLPKIRYRPRLMFFITRPIIFISTFESGVSTSFLYFLLSDIISSVPSSFRLNRFARHSLFEQNT